MASTSSSQARRKFHDVEVYAGRKLVTTASRMEILGVLMESGATNPFLKELLEEQGDCGLCREPVALVFDEEEDTVTEAFRFFSFETETGSSLSAAGRSLLERLGLGPRQVRGGQETEPRDLVELYLGESQ